MQIEKLRAKIDTIDSELVDLLNERAKKVLEIARIKKKERKGYYSAGRERKILERLIKQNKGPLPDEVL